MKRTIIGCCLTCVGAFSNVALIIAVGNHVKEIHGWSTPPGKFWTAAYDIGAVFPVVFSLLIFVVGLFILGFEYRNKSKTDSSDGC